MRIGLITFTKIENYGACLQAYALYQTLVSKGYECAYIDYRRNYLPDLFVWFFRKIYSAVLRIDDEPSYSVSEFIRNLFGRTEVVGFDSPEKKGLYEEFWNLMKYTDSVRKKDLKKIDGLFDLFIAGSDQIWNCGEVNLDTTYLLDFVSGSNRRRNSYASSIALERIPPKYASKYVKMLSRFEHISIREDCGARKDLEKLMPGINIEIVTDPVALISRDEWEAIAVKDICPDDRYILLIDLLKDNDGISHAGEVLSSELGIRVQRIFGSDKYPDENIASPIGPREWLGLLAGASVVITNSFHATIFSLIFEKNFIYLVSDHERIRHTTSRIKNLLEAYSLMDHIVEETPVLSEMDKDLIRIGKQCLDPTFIREVLTAQRERGMRYLEGCLNG